MSFTDDRGETSNCATPSCAACACRSPHRPGAPSRQRRSETLWRSSRAEPFGCPSQTVIARTAVNANSGSPVRSRFLQAYLNQDEDKYTAYWTVRRYIGKGASPRELPRSTDVINFVNSTPGAIGYISEADVQPGVNVLLK